ncbi:MAG: hypothetical protein ABIJ52_13655, partial [Pseudomonadota bacterium]
MLHYVPRFRGNDKKRNPRTFYESVKEDPVKKMILNKRYLSVTNDMSGIVAHNLSGLGWSLLEVADEMDRDATGDPEDAIRGDVF